MIRSEAIQSLGLRDIAQANRGDLATISYLSTGTASHTIVQLYGLVCSRSSLVLSRVLAEPEMEVVEQLLLVWLLLVCLYAVNVSSMRLLLRSIHGGQCKSLHHRTVRNVSRAQQRPGTACQWSALGKQLDGEETLNCSMRQI